MKSRGLGDTIEKITKFTGIKVVVNALIEDCGCDAKRDWLNEAIPYDMSKNKRIINFFKKPKKDNEN